MSTDMGSKVKRAGAVILSFILLSMLINAVQGAPIAVSFTDTVDEMLVDEDQDGTAGRGRRRFGAGCAQDGDQDEKRGDAAGEVRCGFSGGWVRQRCGHGKGQESERSGGGVASSE